MSVIWLLSLSNCIMVIQMPQRAKFTYLVPVDSVQLPQKTEFPREDALPGVYISKSTKEK